MAEPSQKSLEVAPYFRRVIPLWQTPQWLEAARWRRVVRSQPVAIVCRDTLITYAQALPWEVRPKDVKQEDALAADIEGYTEVLNGLGSDFDTKLDCLWQDALDLPIGGNLEVVRWPDGYGPYSLPHPKGHVFKIVNVDGATMFPTYNEQFPMAQRVKGDLTRTVYFAANEIARVLLAPRPEIQRRGYGMAPPERVYLALTLLYRGDTYYANLLLDTPEAGVLDLIDMEKQSAMDWLASFKDLLFGIDPQKIGILYEHEKAAQYIPFGRAPNDMLFDVTTLKYARILAAGYWLSLTDIGLDPKGGTLAGSIRDERRARRTGFGVVKEKTRNLIDNEVLPPYLEFVWIEQDEEALVQRYRAFVLAANAMKSARAAGVLSALEAQQQLVKDGLITIEVAEPEVATALSDPSDNGTYQNSLDRVPASQGGRGEFQAQAEIGELRERVGAARQDSPTFDQMTSVLMKAFGEVIARMGDAQVKKLVKAATRLLFVPVEQAFVALSDTDLPTWLGQRFAYWFGLPSEFDDLPEVQKAGQEILAELDRLLEDDRWWEIPGRTSEGFELVVKLAFSEGALEAARLIQELLYTEGLASTPDLIGLNFELTNPQTLSELQYKAAELVTRVNDGTKYYLKRIITAGTEAGLSSPNIAQLIRDGADAETILREAGFIEGVIEQAKQEVLNVTRARTESIVNTEIARAETDGRVTAWTKAGLTRKSWVHTGLAVDCPCPVCEANILLGFVPIDFLYESVFGPADVPGPPAHPQVDHCHIEFDENEVIAKADTLTPWMGE